MLVLSRKIGETIVIGDNIRITVVESKGEQVRIGIDAPRSVSVHRLEVYEEITRENKNAALTMTSLNNIANIFKTAPKNKE